MEKLSNHPCPRCGREELNIYYSADADERLGAWCENCDLHGYFAGQQLVYVTLQQ